MRAGGAGRRCTWGWYAVGLGLWLLGCDSGPKPGPTPPAASTSASVATAPSAAPSASTPPAYPRVPQVAATQPGCRALALVGDVKAGEAPVRNGSLLHGATWLSLAKGASITLRHTVSTREMTVKGPGLALPCLEGEEEVLLSEGTFESTAGAGARPGAEVVIYTPVGTVSYGDAQITIRASKSRAEVTSTKGEAWVLPAKGASRKGPEKVGSATDKALLTGSGRVEPLLTECERAAAAAEGLAQAVLGPSTGDGGTLGERAAAHLQARKGARGACGAARAAANAEGDAAKRAGFDQRVEQANRRWRSLGAPGSPAAKSSAE